MKSFKVKCLLGCRGHVYLLYIITHEEIQPSTYENQPVEQAISARERTLCFEFQSRSDRRKGHKSCALEMVFRRKVRR